MFHTVLAAAADEYIWRTRRNDIVYGLAYRRIDHGALRDLCSELSKPILPARFRRHQPEPGFGQSLTVFARLLVELQQRRQAADYDPMVRLKRSDAHAVLATARTAVQRFVAAPVQARRVFLGLLLFPPR